MNNSGGGTRSRTNAPGGKKTASDPARGNIKKGATTSFPHGGSQIIWLVAAGAVSSAIVFWFWTMGASQSASLPATPPTSRTTTAQEPMVYGYRIVRRYTHDPKAFTQGLLWLNGSLYESTGLYGESVVREVQLTDAVADASGEGSDGSTSVGTSRVVREVALDAQEFGEGLVHVGGGELLQLLWQVGDGNRFSVSPGDAGHLRRETRGFKTPLSDGWGLEFDGTSLLVTDSGPSVHFLDPSTLELQRSVRVEDEGRIVEMVNELELIDGELWANIFGMDCIARIDPNTGVVLAWIVFSSILNRKRANAAAKKQGLSPPDVFNGIAFDASSRRIFVTGKLWPRLYEIELVPSNMSIKEARRRCIPSRNIFREQR